MFYNLAVLGSLAMENDAVYQPPMPAKKRRRLQDDPALCRTTNAWARSFWHDCPGFLYRTYIQGDIYARPISAALELTVSARVLALEAMGRTLELRQ